MWDGHQMKPSIFVWVFQDIWNLSGEHIIDIFLAPQFALPAWHQRFGTLQTAKTLRSTWCKVAAATDNISLLVYTHQPSSKHLQFSVQAKPFLPSLSKRLVSRSALKNSAGTLGYEILHVLGVSGKSVVSEPPLSYRSRKVIIITREI